MSARPGFGGSVFGRSLAWVALGAALYVGAEIGQSTWLSLLLERDLHAAPAVAAAGLSVLWLGLGVGRLAGGFGARHVGDLTLLRWALALATAFEGVLLLAPGPSTALGAAFGLGVCFGPVFPTLVSAATSARPSDPAASWPSCRLRRPGRRRVPGVHRLGGGPGRVAARAVDLLRAAGGERRALRAACRRSRASEPCYTPPMSTRLFRLCGLVGPVLMLAGVVVPAVGYQGRSGEAYSPFNHFISELGEVGVSQLAWLFNGSLVVSGVLMAVFLAFLGATSARGWAGRRAGRGGGGPRVVSRGPVPMNDLHPHLRAAFTFFDGGLVAVALFTVAVLRDRRGRCRAGW